MINIKDEPGKKNMPYPTMKLAVFCLLAALLVTDSFSEPILGILGRRRLCRGGLKGGLLVTLLGDGDCNTQQLETRRAQEPVLAPAPAPSPSVNVNVQNIYRNQENNHVTHNNRIGAANNNVVNNKLDLNQNINNRAESNVYNRQEVNNRLINNYPEAPVQQACGDGC